MEQGKDDGEHAESKLRDGSCQFCEKRETGVTDTLNQVFGLVDESQLSEVSRELDPDALND